MMLDPAATPSNLLRSCLAIAALSLFLSSCRVTNYPVNKPFVYSTEVNIVGKYTTDEKKTLQPELEQQLDDSIQVRKQRKFLFWLVQNKPPAYDTLNAGKSKIYMHALLNSLGYYRDSIGFRDTIITVGDQQRAYLTFDVMPGKLVTLDSVWYNLLDSVPYRPVIDSLQKITVAAMDQKLIKKGDPFSKPLISAELDRLSDLYRNNGYLRFSREQLIAVWDTVGRDLIATTFDPVELAQQLEALRRRRENPVADVEIRLKSNPDSLRLTRYYIGNIRIYPDYFPERDTANVALPLPRRDTLTASQLEFISYYDLFKARKLIRFVYFRRGDLYRQGDLLKTQNKFNSLGAWRLVTITPLPRASSDTVDFEIRLVPAKRNIITANLEASRNPGVLSEGNLIGLGGTIGRTDRNFAKSAAQAATNFRYGIELGTRLNTIQTQQVTFGHTIQFPRFIPRFNRKPGRTWNDEARTFLAFNIGSIDRLEYYAVRSVNTSWGYEWKSRGNKLWAVRLPNIEYNFLRRRARLDALIAANQSYQYIFSDGLILSGSANLTIAGGKKDVTNVARFGTEESGTLIGLIRNRFLDNNLYRFIKVDAEFVQTRKIRRTALAWRTFLGVGWELPSSHNTRDKYLPFFRQYVAGGPNSMRAWAVRRLGPGSAIKSFDRSIAPDRFGDMRLELNGEYRYYMTQLFGFPLEGALFTDIGNVWFLRKNPDFVNGEFNFGRLYQDLAVGMGTGFRYDFGFLKLRLDFAWKAKDPSPESAEAQNKWFYKWKLGFGTDKKGRQGAQFQLGINYPF